MGNFNDPYDRGMIIVHGSAAYKAEKIRRFNDVKDVGIAVPGSAARRTFSTDEATRKSVENETGRKKSPLGYPPGNADIPNGFHRSLGSIIGSILNEKIPLGYSPGDTNNPYGFYYCIGSIVGSILALVIFIVLMLIIL